MDTEIEPDEDLEVRPRRSERYLRKEWYWKAFLVIAAVTFVAGGLRFYQLSKPRGHVFDEVYYAKDGCLDAGIDYRACELDGPREQTVGVHPPLGRELIALGVRAFGNRPFGWRVAPAIAGTLSVALVSLLAFRLFGSLLWAGVAGLLLATESLNFVQSRISMLDIFIATFVVAGFLFIVLDRQWMDRRNPPTQERLTREEQEEAILLDLPPDRPPSPILRPWRIAAGMAFGAAMATKWSGGLALLGAILLSLGWERTRRERAGLPHPLWETVRAEAFGIFVFLLLLPLAVYVATYARWFSEHGWVVGEWLELHKNMATFSIDLAAEHPYASRPWTWMLLVRPVAYYYKSGTPPGTAAEILGVGNPAIFWGSIVALAYALVRWMASLGPPRTLRVVLWASGACVGSIGLVWIVRSIGPELAFVNGREAELAIIVFLLAFLTAAAVSGEGFDWTAGFVVVAFASQYLPWFATPRTSFLFYMTPITPFMVLAIVYALQRMANVRVGIPETRPLAPLAGLAVGVALAVFIFFFPVLTGRTISEDQWRARIWFSAEHTSPWNWI